MQLILVTGLSGAGKSIAIRQLEDSGYYCIDNLPATFLKSVVCDLRKNGTSAAAVAIDARTQGSLENIQKAVESLRDEGFDVRPLFLTASTATLVQRFSETRRRHPLSMQAGARRDELLTLQEAIESERDQLAPLTKGAALIDSTNLLPAQLRKWIQDFIAQPQAQMTLTFESFAFKHGLPVAADLVFDVRCLPNPYYTAELRPLTGKDRPVADFLKACDSVNAMVADIAAFIEKWLPSFINQNRHYLTVGIGCTGGQHRSVYVAEALGQHFKSRSGVVVRHRIIEQKHLLAPAKSTQTA